MKRQLLPLLLIIAAIFQSCSGPEGPQGPRGEDGESVNILGTTIDLVNVNFTSQNEFQYVLSFANEKLEVYESDAVLVYSHWEDVTSNGQTVAAYRLLPQTAFLTNGILTYNFDRTVNDVSIFLDGTVNLASVPNQYTRNQNFRIVILPSDFATRRNGNVDYSDYNAVVKAFNIDESKVRTISAK